MRDEYKSSWIRDRAARLHESLLRASSRLKRWSDWLALVGVGSLMLVVMASVGSVALPIAGTNTDFIIWLAVPLVVTAALATLLRSLRSRRHGSSASTQVQGPRDVLQVVVVAWLGLVAIGGFIADARGGSGLTGLGIFSGLVGVSLLFMDAVLVYRYVMRE
jgi:hypothetical protein